MQPSTSARPRNCTGSRCSPATSGPSSGPTPRTRPTSWSSSTTTTRPRSPCEMIPTFALGLAADSFTPARRGLRAAPRARSSKGHPDLAAHLAQALIRRRVRPDADEPAGRRPRSDGSAVSRLRLSRPSGRSKVIPLGRQRRAVPAAHRKPLPQPRSSAIASGCRRATLQDLNGAGLGYRWHEPPAARTHEPGLINQEFDHGLPRPPRSADPDGLAHDAAPGVPPRESGSEGIELVMWLIMRGAHRRARRRGAPPLLPRASFQHSRRTPRPPAEHLTPTTSTTPTRQADD